MQTCRFSISSLCFRCSSCSFSSYSRCSFAERSCSAWALASREDSTWTVHSTAEIKPVQGWLLHIDTRIEDADAAGVWLCCSEMIRMCWIQARCFIYFITTQTGTVNVSELLGQGIREGMIISTCEAFPYFSLFSSCHAVPHNFSHQLVDQYLNERARGGTSTVMFWNLWMHEGVCEWVSVHAERCVRRVTSSLKVWFSACAAASSLSLSLSFSCVFSQVLRKLFTSSLLSTLLWQFSRRDFCKGSFFYSSSRTFSVMACSCHGPGLHRFSDIDLLPAGRCLRI